MGTPDYIKKVNKPSINWEYFDVLISRFALDFIEPTPVFALATGIVSSAINSLVTTTITTTTDQLTIPQERIKNLKTTKGYSRYTDGANFLSTSQILLSSTINQVQKDGYLIVPFINSGQLLRLVNQDDTIIADLQATISDKTEEQIQYAIYNLNGVVAESVSITDGNAIKYVFEVV